MLALAVELGLVRVGLVALDSTRVQANASPGANRTEEWIRHEVAEIIAEARANDEHDARAPAEGSEGDIPQELVDENDRLARLLAAKARLEAEAAERTAAYEAKLAKRRAFKEATGREMVGRKPKPPEERQKDAQRSKKANTTDPDSRTMSTANDGYQQGYNAQAVVTADQITIAVSVTNDAKTSPNSSPWPSRPPATWRRRVCPAPWGSCWPPPATCPRTTSSSRRASAWSCSSPQGTPAIRRKGGSPRR